MVAGFQFFESNHQSSIIDHRSSAQQQQRFHLLRLTLLCTNSRFKHSNCIMTDHAEEQEMEAEAMAAIFDTNFEVLEPTDNDHHRVWSITIYPETGTTDEQELESLNHVGCRLVVTLPETYPEIEPVIHIEIVKGLAAEHQDEIQQLALEEATNNIGTPSIYAITERVREWLIENNTKGLDDISMHAQMIRKKLQEEKSKVGYDRAFWNIHLVHHLWQIVHLSVARTINVGRV